MLNLFLYGCYAHVNDEKAQEFERWTKIPFMRGLIEIRLFDLLRWICGAIEYVGTLNGELVAAAGDM
jgi:hypothetical protein